MVELVVVLAVARVSSSSNSSSLAIIINSISLRSTTALVRLYTPDMGMGLGLGHLLSRWLRSQRDMDSRPCSNTSNSKRWPDNSSFSRTPNGITNRSISRRYGKICSRHRTNTNDNNSKIRLMTLQGRTNRRTDRNICSAVSPMTLCRAVS